MKTINVNGISFKGQFAENYEFLMKGNKVSLWNFSNGSWEPTTKISRFMHLLNQAGIEYNKIGDSLRNTELTIK